MQNPNEKPRLSLLFSLIFSLLLLAQFANAAEPSSEIPLRNFLVISRVGGFGRSAIRQDPVEARIVSGQWTAPTAGETLTLPDGSSREWGTMEAGPDGWLKGRSLGGAYAYASVDLDAPRVMLLQVAGDSMVYVNGEPRVGDVYSNDNFSLPVSLRKGRNDFLFNVSRGQLKAKLVAPDSPCLLDARDPTLPDLVQGEKTDAWGAVVVLNATGKAQDRLSLAVSGDGLNETRTSLPVIPPYSLRKVGFRLRGPSPKKPGEIAARLQLRSGDGPELSSAETKLRVRRPTESRKVTFVSDIDGSVQYYAIQPAHPLPGETGPLALFLSLHGAGVEAIGQADAYESKTWGNIVAPTNRRPYGFDWEDWGRLDAMEVLKLATERLHPDPKRIYLTGHSMGGHGTWQVGATFPDRFAAIGPSAGWISFATYGGGRAGGGSAEPTPVEAMLSRAADPSDTFSLSKNYVAYGVYILHGEADDNVPISQAERMAENLETFHHDFVFYRQPNAGHWWDVSDEPGADCVDWPAMFDFFARHSLPSDESVREIYFVTASPGVSARFHWATIQAQTHPLQYSTINIRWDPGKRRFNGRTENVERLALDLKIAPSGDPLSVTMDGQRIDNIPYPKGKDRTLYLARVNDRWSVAGKPSPAVKNPDRYGPFKEAFNRRMIFVYGTHGSPEENAWAFAKARYDAESFYYRGNGAIDVVPDSGFRPNGDKDRSVILYGNAATNSAWKPLLSGSPIQAERGRIRVGARELAGDDLACLFVRPRPGSDVAEVGVVSGSGIAGMRLTDRLTYLSSGTALPDYLVLGSNALSRGSAGIRAAGFFGPDWSVENGDSAWNP
jgi:dienelactone hydrolase